MASVHDFKVSAGTEERKRGWEIHIMPLTQKEGKQQELAGSSLTRVCTAQKRGWRGWEGKLQLERMFSRLFASVVKGQHNKRDSIDSGP